MRDDQKLGIVQELKKKNMQETMRPSETKIDTDLDWKLSYCIYNYLLGNMDTLPPYNFIEELSKEARHSEISMGYGVLINKNLRISIESMIRANLARVDIISEDGYSAYVLNEETGKMIDIDVKYHPRFDPKRVEQVIMYIDEYLNGYKKSDGDKEKLL